MSNLYDRALVIMPDGHKVTVQSMIDIITLKALTPQKIQWIDIMVHNQLEHDGALGALVIKPGCYDYVYRQIIAYAMDAMIGDQTPPVAS